MKLMNKPRRSGKTELMIEIAYILDIPLIVATQTHKKYVEQMVKAKGYEIEVYTCLEWNRSPHSLNTKVVIDECEQLMKTALGMSLQAEIVAGTLTLPMKGE